MSECTVVSLLPYPLEEGKPSLIPGVFYIPACEDKKIPVVIHVNDGFSRLYIRDGKTFPVTHPGEEIAQSIVEDYCTSQLEADADARPAIFWVSGKLSPMEVITKHKKTLDDVKTKQNRWFLRLVKRADDDYAVSKQSRMVTELQRKAAAALGLRNKEWMQELEPIEHIKCPFCSTIIEEAAAVCKNCNNVTNKEKAQELGMKVSA